MKNMIKAIDINKRAGVTSMPTSIGKNNLGGFQGMLADLRDATAPFLRRLRGAIESFNALRILHSSRYINIFE